MSDFERLTILSVLRAIFEMFFFMTLRRFVVVFVLLLVVNLILVVAPASVIGSASFASLGLCASHNTLGL